MPPDDGKGFAMIGGVILWVLIAICLVIAASSIDQLPGEPVVRGMVTFVTLALVSTICLLILVIYLERRGRADLR